MLNVDFQGISLAIFSAVFGVLVGGIGPFWQKYIRKRRLKTFWKFINDEVAIIYPMYDDPRFGEGAPKTMAQVEDVLAMDEISRLMKTLGKKYYLLDHTREVDNRMDLVLICSPIGNYQSKMFAETHKDEMPFTLDVNDLKFIDQDGMKISSPMDDESSPVAIDIGLVARITDKNPRRNVFIFWGIHGPGTLGAVKFSINEKKIKTAKFNPSNPKVAFLVKVPFHRVNEEKGGGPREPGDVTTLL